MDNGAAVQEDERARDVQRNVMAPPAAVVGYNVKLKFK